MVLDAPAARRRSGDADDDGRFDDDDDDERQGERRTLQVGIRRDDPSCSGDWIRWRVR